MNVSVSLPDDDVQFLDAYARTQGLDSRSAALHEAVRLLRSSEPGGYRDAWQGWVHPGDGELWDETAVDGLRA